MARPLEGSMERIERTPVRVIFGFLWA